LFAITKELDKKSKVNLNDYKFFGKASSDVKDSDFYSLKSFYINGALEWVENEDKRYFFHTGLKDFGH